ncbi:MBL fold metallo-hydrolase [Nocardioides campestrisoli]|uniref:MBL fold metallo-hydrolase n=1 Tax=Nocardioides campestrisoli TaxID=2736757 RepID=UPI00163DDBC9|nr:MBL fold metallo-hydrolase [Nocardioides campestrisoli]
MRITKFGHSCVRLEHGPAVLVLDPGVFTEVEAVARATAVLVTHEHPDHFHPDHLRAARAPIVTIDSVAARIRDEAPDLVERTRVVAPEELLDLGVPVRVVGREHAVIHPDLPRVHNSGYLVDLGGTRVYHPGDALIAPGEPVDVLCAPASAPWLKLSEAVDFVREVGAPRNLAIHEAIYSEAGSGIVDGHMERLNGPRGLAWSRLAAGEDLVL